MPADFVSLLFGLTGLHGPMYIYAMDTSTLYHKASARDIILEVTSHWAEGGDWRLANLYGITFRSAMLFPPREAEGNLSRGCTIVFTLPESAPEGYYSRSLSASDYTGNFLQMTMREDEFPNNLIVNDFKDHGVFGFVSMLLLKTPLASERVQMVFLSFRDLFLDRWNEQIGDMLEKAANPDVKEISQDGNPILTWEMFPDEISGLDSDYMYLKIFQKIKIKIDSPFGKTNYKVTVTYWIELFKEEGGEYGPTNDKIRGTVAKIYKWVEDGKYKPEVSAAMNQAIIDGMDALNDALNEELNTMLEARLNEYGVTNYSIARLYYLPGRQTPETMFEEVPKPGLVTGSTFDDVTIAVEITDLEIGGIPWPTIEKTLFSDETKTFLDWIYKQRSKYESAPFGKRTLEWYRALKRAGLLNAILRDKKVRDLSLKLIERGEEIFKSKEAKVSTSDTENLGFLLNKLEEITEKKDLKTLDLTRSFTANLVGKTFGEVERELDEIMRDSNNAK